MKLRPRPITNPKIPHSHISSPAKEVDTITSTISAHIRSNHTLSLVNKFCDLITLIRAYITLAEFPYDNLAKIQKNI